MKLRSILLVFACLLMAGSLTSATTSAQDDTPTVVPGNKDMAFTTPAEASPGCSADELAFLNPAPEQKVGGAPCGACSQTVCQGYTTGTICGYANGVYKRCQSVYGYSCTTGGLECSCWSGPLP